MHRPARTRTDRAAAYWGCSADPVRLVRAVRTVTVPLRRGLEVRHPAVPDAVGALGHGQSAQLAARAVGSNRHSSTLLRVAGEYGEIATAAAQCAPESLRHAGQRTLAADRELTRGSSRPASATHGVADGSQRRQRDLDRERLTVTRRRGGLDPAAPTSSRGTCTTWG